MERPRGVMGMGMVMVEVMDTRAATDCILQLLSLQLPVAKLSLSPPAASRMGPEVRMTSTASPRLSVRDGGLSHSAVAGLRFKRERESLPAATGLHMNGAWLARANDAAPEPRSVQRPVPKSG